MIQKREYKKRQQKLFSHFAKEKGVIVLVSPKPAHKSGDAHFEFVQNKNILYISGIDAPNTAVVFELKTQKVILFAQKPNLQKEIWVGKLPDFVQLKKNYPVDEVQDIRELENYLKKEKKIHSLEHAKPTHTKIIDKPLKRALFAMRIIKSDAELACIKKASHYTKQMYAIVQKMIQDKKSPLTIKARLDLFIIENKLTHAFNPIITTHGAVLHNEIYETAFKKSQLLLVDMGAQYNNYASDFTRTIPTSTPTQKQQMIIDIVRRVKDKTIAYVKLGLALFEIHTYAQNLLIEELRGLGILTGTIDEIRTSKVITVFFPHGIGHHLGLDTHDLSELTEKDHKPVILNERMVITIEPGVYFIETYLNNLKDFPHFKKHIDVKKMRAFAKEVSGVRDEDTIVITKTGAKRLVNIP